MNSFLDRIRSGAGKAAFEADKLRRMNAVQSEIKGLRDEVRRVLNRVGHVAYDLYRDGQIQQPALQETCRQVQALQEQVQAHETELESIRQEEYVEETPTAHYGRICPQGHGPIPPENNFCQECGARAVEVPPPTSANRFCQDCGQPLGPEARFCANCGAPAPEHREEPALAFCDECGTKLLPDAVFCSECGTPVLVGEQAGETPSDVPAAPEVEAVSSERAESLSEEESGAVSSADEGVGGGAETSPVDLAQESAAPSWESSEEVVGDGEERANQAQEMSAQKDYCPACNMPLLPEALFCAECGYQLENA